MSREGVMTASPPGDRLGWLSEFVQASQTELFVVAGRAVTPLNLALTPLLVLGIWCLNVWLRGMCERKFLANLDPAPATR